MKNLRKLFCAILIGSCCFGTAVAQTKAAKKAAKEAKITQLIDAQNYVFKANYANPTGGMQSRNLTSDYDLVISKDTVKAFLPYFGRAYLADYNDRDGGIKFTSTSFDYHVTANKKGSREIMIKPLKSSLSDPKAVQSMVLRVSPDGYASLQVISLNRSPISFDGVVEERSTKNL